LRAIVLITLPDLHQSRVAQDLQMPAQVAVGQGAEFLEIVKHQPAGMRGKRRDDAKPGLFVDETIQPVVGKAAAVFRFLRIRHEDAPMSSRECRRPTTGRRRTESPSPTEKMRIPPEPTPGSKFRPRDTTGPQ